MLMKCENYCRASQRLAEALAEYASSPSSTVLRDGVIQRFESTSELAWKSLKAYMEDQGATGDLNFPKGVLKAAFAAGLISDEAVWLDMLASRNMTSHIYDDAQAAQVLSSIQCRYMEPFATLARSYAALEPSEQ